MESKDKMYGGNTGELEALKQENADLKRRLAMAEGSPGQDKMLDAIKARYAAEQSLKAMTEERDRLREEAASHHEEYEQVCGYKKLIDAKSALKSAEEKIKALDQAARLGLRIAEGCITSEYEGTRYFKNMLAELDPIRKALEAHPNV